MENQFAYLKELQLDILKEIGNIGAGHAATALSSLIHKPIDMKVPKVEILSFNEITNFIGGDELPVVASYFRVEGDIPSNLFFIMTVDSAKNLLYELLGTNANESFSDFEISALKEISNILTGSYLSSLADFTNLRLVPTVPAFAVDMVAAVLSYGLIQMGNYGDVALLIDTRFFENNSDLTGYFFLLPDPDSIDKLFSAIGVPIE